MLVRPRVLPLAVEPHDADVAVVREQLVHLPVRVVREALEVGVGAVDGVANGTWDWVPDASGDWGTVDALDAAEVMANFGSCN